MYRVPAVLSERRKDMKRFYTAESVTEGHPDKLCDLIADSILDECLKGDPEARVACEVLATKGTVLLAGEITSKYEPDVLAVAEDVVEKSDTRQEKSSLMP